MKNVQIKVLKVGKISTYKTNDENKKELVSAIKKIPIKNSYLTFTGFRDDEQADKVHHGGKNKAVLFMSTKTYEKIEMIANEKLDLNSGNALGENILIDGIDENDVCVGDKFHLGEALVEVSQPREPCWKLSANTNIKEMTKIVYRNGFTGWYVRVLKEGFVKDDDLLIFENRDYPTLTIKKLNELLIDPLKDEELTNLALKCEKLSEAFKESLEKKYKSKK